MAALALAVRLFLFDRGAAPGIGASGRPTVAVLAFDTSGAPGDIAWLAKGLPSMLVTGLAQTPGLDVVSNERIDEILKDSGQPGGKPVDGSRALEIGLQVGAGAIVAGRVIKTGTRIRIDARVQDIATGRLLTAHTVSGGNVFPIVDDLTTRIRNDLNVAAGGASRGIADITSSNLEAYRLFTEGVDAFTNQRLIDSRKLLEEAVRLDPTFAISYSYLSVIAENIGDRAAAEDYRRKLVANLVRLPERQRLVAQSEAASRAGDNRMAAEILENLTTRYPDEGAAYGRLGALYALLGDNDKAFAALARGVKAVPTYGPLHDDYGYAFLATGRYPEAIRELETYARLNPKEPNPYDSLGEAYLVTGQPEKALEMYATTLQIDPLFRSSLRGRAWAYGMLGRYDEALTELGTEEAVETKLNVPTTDVVLVTAFTLARVGRYREAEQQLRDAERLADQFQDFVGASRTFILTSLFSLATGNQSRALEYGRRAEEMARRLPGDGGRVLQSAAWLMDGIAEIRAGKPDSAASYLDRQSKSLQRSPQLNWLYHCLEGEIALARHDLAAAEAAFKAGEPLFKPALTGPSAGWPPIYSNLPFRDGPARAKVASGDLKGAIEIYRRLITPGIRPRWTAMLEPRFVLQLAQLLDRTGDRAGARAQYERFLDLWKHADSDLPELAEVRGRLRQL